MINSPSHSGDIKKGKIDNGVQHTTLNQINSLTPTTISKGNSSVSYLPQVGGHMVSCKIHGVELFHPQFGDPNKPKGGMPYMFPNAGPLTDNQKKLSGLDLAQHGFGRTSKWKDLGDGVMELAFESTDEFPFSGVVRHEIEILDSGDIIFHQHVRNTGINPMPIATGLHPYFRIPNGDKSSIIWRCRGDEEICPDINIWANGGTCEHPMPLDNRIRFYIPELGEITLEPSNDYTRFWVWSLNEKEGEKDFICVEPVMRSVGGIVDNPQLVEPGTMHSSFMKISLNK